LNGSGGLPPLNLSAEFSRSLQQKSPLKNSGKKKEIPKPSDNLNLTIDRFVTKEMLGCPEDN
jgi:hypothetical protein